MGFFSDVFGGGDMDGETGLTAASAVLFEREPSCREIHLVGESHYQRAIRKVTGRVGNESLNFDCIGTLVPEPDNEYDENAIGVQIEGEKVGYLSRGDATAYQKVTQKAERQGKFVAGEARIGAFDSEDAETTNAGVVIWLPPPSEAAEAI
uniref:HIRAN domain-containing protein n=1 Tax=uncultured prokaryote TaxID=198431 RepID=A0A0H5Q8C6_9ZZZZ|nr:hypothetical protein [uncultured prokaryote]